MVTVWLSALATRPRQRRRAVRTGTRRREAGLAVYVLQRRNGMAHFRATPVSPRRERPARPARSPVVRLACFLSPTRCPPQVKELTDTPRPAFPVILFGRRQILVAVMKVGGQMRARGRLAPPAVIMMLISGRGHSCPSRRWSKSKTY